MGGAAGGIDGVAAALTEAALAGAAETDLVAILGDGLAGAGVPVARITVIVDTLHPIWEGRVSRWQRGGGAPTLAEYGRTLEGPAEEAWQRSPFFHLLQSGAPRLRLRLDAPDPRFPIVEELAAEGLTDYVAGVARFRETGAVGGMDCVLVSYATDRPGGFDESDLAGLEATTPAFALAMKCVSLARIATTLVETYLGRDAGRRVLAGRIERGVAERIETVVWFSDLRGYTRIGDTAPPETVIPLLNDYAEALVPAITGAGGEVLKLIGDGILAIFPAAESAAACRAALDAERIARERVAALNARRRADGLPVTEFYLGLELGEVFYGNIGSADRLDFTVVGPAVNAAARIAQMCRSVDQKLLVSSTVAAALGPDRRQLVSVGRYALRGIARPEELFTRDPTAALLP